jgi:FOG: Ankyrin repeat
LKLYLKNRADPNIARHSDSVTPLFIATQKGYLRVVKELLKKGADTYQASNDGTTPLQYAEMYGLDEIAAVLREVPNNNNLYSGSNESDNDYETNLIIFENTP